MIVLYVPLVAVEPVELSDTSVTSPTLFATIYLSTNSSNVIESVTLTPFT